MINIFVNKLQILLIPISIGIGLLSALNNMLMIYLVFASIYIFLVVLFLNVERYKKVIPFLFVFVLFQDLLSKNIPYLGPYLSYLDEVFIIISIPIILIRYLKGVKLRGSKILVTMLILLALGCVSSLLNKVPVLISLQGAFLMFKGLLFFYIFYNIPFEKSDFVRCIKWVKISVSVIVLFSFIDFFFYDKFRPIIKTDDFNEFRLGIINIKSLFIHAGVYGWFMVLVSIYFLSQFYVKKMKRNLFASAFFLFLSVLSFRYKVFLSIISVVLVLYLKMGLRRVLAFMLPFVFLLSILALFFGEAFLELTTLTIERYINVDMYESARKALYQVSFLISMNDFPLGEGFGRFGGYIAKIYYSPVYYEYGLHTIYGLRPDDPKWATDTYWPNIIGEIGLLGALILLGLYLKLILNLFKKYNNIKDQDLKVYILFSAFILLQGLVESIGEPIFNSAPQNIFIFGTLGIIYSILKEQNTSKKEKY
jgi:hypothetical protein